MHQAAAKGHIQIMQHLMQHAASLGYDTQPWFQQALVEAACCDRANSAAWLLEQGMTDEEVGNVLAFAASVISVAVIRVLLTQQPGCVSIHGALAVDTALRENRLEAARVLLELAAPEAMSLSWPAFIGESEQATFESLKSQMSKYPLEPLAPVLEAAIQHGHSQVARVLRFCGATCSLEGATGPHHTGAAPAGGLHPIN
jgi:hypothetical protein